MCIEWYIMYIPAGPGGPGGPVAPKAKKMLIKVLYITKVDLN